MTPDKHDHQADNMFSRRNFLGKLGIAGGVLAAPSLVLAQSATPKQRARIKAMLENNEIDQAEAAAIIRKYKHELSPEQQTRFLRTLEARLSTEQHYQRPEGVNFAEVKKALEANPELMWSLAQMEETGGAPDVIAVENDAFVFGDCSAESPAGSGRRDLTYEQAAEMARKFGVKMMTEQEYKKMQETGEFDRKTISWLESADIINTGLARRGNRNYGRVIVFRRYADRYYSDKGWRASLRVPKS